MVIRHFIFSVSVLMLCNFSFGQKGISYQGVILYPTIEIPGIDSNVTPYSEKDVCIRFGVYDDMLIQTPRLFSFVVPTTQVATCLNPHVALAQH